MSSNYQSDRETIFWICLPGFRNSGGIVLKSDVLKGTMFLIAYGGDLMDSWQSMQKELQEEADKVVSP